MSKENDYSGVRSALLDMIKELGEAQLFVAQTNLSPMESPRDLRFRLDEVQYKLDEARKDLQRAKDALPRRVRVVI